MEWQDINTAPKDGTPVIGLRFPASENPTMCGTAYFNGRNWIWLGAHYLEPTHWIEFPKPPRTHTARISENTGTTQSEPDTTTATLDAPDAP